MWGFHEGMAWWFVFGGIWMVAFWAIVIGLSVWAIAKIKGTRHLPVDTGEPSVEIARKRLARGEISKDEFDELIRVLR